MSSMSELEPTKVEYWDKMSDQKACASAKMRDIGVPDMSEMDDTAKLLASRGVKVKLSTWYRQWGDKRLPPPEGLENDEIWDHAEELGLELPEAGTAVEARQLRVAIMLEHVKRQELEARPADLDGDDDEDDDDLIFSHPNGLSFAARSGKCRSSFPDGSAVPDAIQEAYGAILITHRDIRDDSEERTGDVEQEFSCITGIGHRSLGTHNYTYEVTSLNTFLRTTMRPAKFTELELFDNWAEPMAIFRSDHLERATERWKRGMCRSPSMSSGSVVSLRSSRLGWNCIWDRPHVDFDDLSSLIGIPKILIEGSREGQLNKKNSFDLAASDQKKDHVADLRRCLKESMQDLVSALERDLEPYRQPGMQNLVTGEDLDPRSTETERLTVLSQTYSQPVATREVRSFCAGCTAAELSRRVELDPTLDSTDKDLLNECFVWGEDAHSKGCGECGRRLHPNLETPTKCSECLQLQFCAGKLRVCCPDCRCSYVDLGADKDYQRSAAKAQSGDTAQREADNMIYHYVRLTGGTSFLYESAKDVTAARLELRTKCGSFFQEGRDYRITPRHVFYGCTLCFSAYPDGRDGLTIRDFIPQRSRLFQALSDGAQAEGPNGERAGALDVSIFDDGGEWSNLLPHEKLGGWIETNMPTAPNYPVDPCESHWLSQEGVYHLALCNAIQFIIDAGTRRAWEAKKTLEELVNLGKGTFGLSLPDQEHHACLTLHSFYDRIRTQCRDFSRNQLYAFEKEDRGWAVRLFYAPTLPKIIQMSRLPKEVSQTHRASREVYSGRFNTGGMGLSYTPDNKVDKPAPKTKVGQKAKATKMSHSTEDPIVRWTPGEVLGDRIPPVEKNRSLTTVAADGQPYCISFQSVAGCTYEDGDGGVACPCKHEHVWQWHPQLVRVIMSLGGFKNAPPVHLSQLRQWMPHQQFPEPSTTASKVDSVLRSIDLTLERTVSGNIEKRPIHSIIDGLKSIQMFSITPVGQSLIPLCSPAGLATSHVQALTVGTGCAYVDGNSLDHGGSVRLCDGSMLKNRCLVKNIAAMVSKHQTFVNAPGASADLELLRQVNNDLLELDIEEMPLDSWLAETYMDSSNAEVDGYSESLWDIINPDYTRHTNLLMFSQGKLRSSSDLAGLGVLLWKAGAKMEEPRTSWHSNAAYSSRFLKEWGWGAGAVNGSITSVVSYVPDATTMERHTLGFILPAKLNKFNAVIQQLEKFNLFVHDKVEFVVGSPGMTKAAAKRKGRQVWTREQLRAARRRIVADQELVMGGTLPREVNPHLNRALRLKEGLTEPTSKVAASSLDTEAEEEMPKWTNPDPPMVEDQESERRTLSSHPTWVKALEYLDKMEAVIRTSDVSSVEGVRAAIQIMQDSADVLLAAEEESPFWPHKTNIRLVARVVSLLRFIRFGPRVAEGPEIEDIPKRFLHSLTDAHKQAYVELVTKGHAPAKLSSGRGYASEHRPDTDAATYQIWKSYWDTAVLLRSVNLNLHHKKGLVQSGVPLAPLGVVEKLDDRKEVRFEEDGVTKKLRSTHDHTDGGHAEAHNTGVHSYRTSKQMGTDDSTIAAKFIKEENANQGYFIGVSKKDYAGAYTICQDREEDVGLRASEHLGVLNVNASLTFGGADASGVWEIMGSAASDASAAIAWPDSAKDGSRPPRHDRSTDDTFHEVAHRGNRQKRYMKGFEQLMRVFAGKSSNNVIKDGESGDFTPKQHAFGSLVDAVRRRFISPLSRLCRVEAKVREFLEDPDRHFTGLEVPSIRGSLNSALKNAPQLQDLVMSRFDAMLSDTALKFGIKSPPPDFEPSPALPDSGESKEEGQRLLKLSLSVVWRFVVLGNGKYIYRTFEECLELEYRDALPGKEGPESRFTPESDSSGQGMFYFDPDTGKYMQRWFTEAEKEAMFQYDKVTGNIIITNLEFLAPVEGIPLTIFDHPKATYVVIRNDNQNVVDNINSGKAGNALNFDCLMFLKLLSFLLGKMFYAKYVNTKHNKRSDAGTREDLQGELDALMHQWESSTGKKKQKISPVTKHISLESWVAQSQSPNFEGRMDSVWLKLLEVLERSLEQGTAWQFKVPVPDAISIIKQALSHSPIPSLDRSCGDYPTTEGPSKARLHVEECAAKGVLTRTSLTKKVNQIKGYKQSLAAEMGVSSSTPDQQLFSLVLQRQFDTTMSPLWKECTAFDPTHPKITSPQVIKHTHPCVNPPIRVGEDYAGQASFCKSARDSGGSEVVYLSERNTALHPHLEEEFPRSQIFEHNHEVTADYITKHKIEGVMGGPPCQDHSQGNQHRKGNGKGHRTGREFQNAGSKAAAAYGGTGTAWQLWECAPGVHSRSKGGGKSPYDELIANNPSMHDALGGRVLRADRIKSPLTGCAAPVHHSRSYVALVNNLDFAEDAQLEIEEAATSLAKTWDCNRESDKQTPGRFCMPMEDTVDFCFEHKESEGVAYMGHILNPPVGYGNGAFPSKASDPQNGLAVTFTTGGGKWIQNSINGLPAFTHVSVREAAANNQLRGLPDGMLNPWSTFGREVVSHAVLGNMADALVCAVQDLYLKPMTIEQSKKKGFSFQISPREHFLHRTQGIMPQSSAEEQGQVSKATGVSAEDIREKWHATAQVRNMKKKVRLHTHKAGVLTRTTPQLQGGIRGIHKGKGQKKRAKPIITPEINARLDKHMLKVRNPKLKNTQDNQARHFIDFYEANGWPSLIEDPTHPLEQYRLRRWISYECGVKGIKGDSVKAKFPAVNKYHKRNGKLPPFEYALDAVQWASECKREDTPSQPKLCVPKQLIEVYAIEQDMANNTNVEAEVCGMATAVDYALRSMEYSEQDTGKVDPRALHWRDVFLKDGAQRLEGWAVRKCDRMTLSLCSSKNSLRRCTRTTYLMEAEFTNAVRLVRNRYLRILGETGKPPNPNAPVFQYKSGRTISRKGISKIIQDLMASVGVPRRFVASHSLRRTGASLLAATGLASDEDIKRWGRWTSNAYKLYVHLENSRYKEWAEAVARIRPIFELN